ncbi:Aspartate aminotransferase, mitochondrial, partial [Dermatophagoides pteronyssinus]
FWNKITLAPRDPILSINQLYQQDPNPKKINLSIGTYRTENNESYVFPTVRKAEKIVFNDCSNLDKEYSPMEGFMPFNREAFRLLFGDDFGSLEKSSITVQTLAGTGALDLGAAFLSKFFQGHKQVSISNPSWINHYFIFRNYNFNIHSFRYYDYQRKTFDENGFFDDLKNLPNNSVILFQPCGHNPSAIELNLDQWMMVSRIVRDKNLLPFFDIAYHGLCSGNIVDDVNPIRLFAEHGHVMLVSQSFSKNMSIYCDRVGSLTVVCDSEQEAYRVQSQLKNIIISKYICPPIQGGRLVASILTDSTLKHEWKKDLQRISQRLLLTRKQLQSKLMETCPANDHQWRTITEQRGIFWYSGLTSSQVETLINDFSIYLCEDGRVNIAGLNRTNMDLFVNVLSQILNNS